MFTALESPPYLISSAGGGLAPLWGEAHTRACRRRPGGRSSRVDEACAPHEERKPR